MIPQYGRSVASHKQILPFSRILGGQIFSTVTLPLSILLSADNSYTHEQDVYSLTSVIS